MKTWDYVIAGVITVFAIGLLGFYTTTSASHDEGPKVLEVYIGDVLHKRIEIPDQHYTQTLSVLSERGMNTIRIRDGAVSIIEADCRDHLCEFSRPISKLDEIIVCMPNRVICTLVSE